MGESELIFSREKSVSVSLSPSIAWGSGFVEAAISRSYSATYVYGRMRVGWGSVNWSSREASGEFYFLLESRYVPNLLPAHCYKQYGVKVEGAMNTTAIWSSQFPYGSEKSNRNPTFSAK